MKLAVVASLLATAAAFAPATKSSSKTALNSVESEFGAQPPLGFFDPLGLVADGDQEKFDRLRFVELKHGRICMLAFLGQVVTRAGYHLPGNIDKAGHAFSSYPNGLAAVFGPEAIPGEGLWQIIAFCGVLEVVGWKQAEGSFPGDFSGSAFPVGWYENYSEEEKLEYRAKELNQGRAAMMGILGLMVHEKMGGSLPLWGEL